MISRQWRGLAHPHFADTYVLHLRTETLPQLSGIPGFINSSVLRRLTPEGVEFLVVTQWESLAAIEKFAGRDPEAAVVPEKVQKMMIKYDHRARHFEVVI
jgi:heme-degrading monooxygenase HmoA